MAAKNLFIVLSLSLSLHLILIHDDLHSNRTSNTHETPAGKEEERAMFQQMQAMAQKQVNIEPLFCNTLCLILI
jgi:hypothetical protein